MVDELVTFPTSLRVFKAGSCHLTTDGPIDALHAFARKLGMKRSWFQDHPLAPHYDLTASKRAMALELGAVFVPARHQAIARRNARATLSNSLAELERTDPKVREASENYDRMAQKLLGDKP